MALHAPTSYRAITLSVEKHGTLPYPPSVSLIPVLLGIIFVTFVLVRSIPGDPCTAMLGEKASPEACAAFPGAVWPER